MRASTMVTTTTRARREAVMFCRAVLPGLSLLFAAGLLSAQAPVPALETPESFGTAAGYTTMMGYDLRQNDDTLLDGRHGATICKDFFGLTDAVMQGYGHLALPDGAKLSQLQFWAYDVNPDWLTVSLHETCQAVGFNPPVTTELGSADTYGTIGRYFGFVPLNDHRVNNRDCAYTVRVHFTPAGVCRGDQLSIQKVHVSWFRDVSPGPPTATFSDVPTSHPFFQYVEALVKSGVTGGCGAGKYCPDAPLKRGQMAVFLSRALGLQWP